MGKQLSGVGKKGAAGKDGKMVENKMRNKEIKIKVNVTYVDWLRGTALWAAEFYSHFENIAHNTIIIICLHF